MLSVGRDRKFMEGTGARVGYFLLNFPSLYIDDAGMPPTCSTVNWRASRPAELHREPLSEPDVNVSVHTAPTTEPPFTICQ